MKKQSASRKKIMSPIMAASIGLGFLVAISLFLFLSAQTVDVLVAKQDIPAGTRVEATQFEVKTLNQDSLVPGVITADQADFLAGKITDTKIIHGLPVAQSQFHGKEVNSVVTNMAPEGKTVITVAADQFKAISDQLTTLDRLNVYATLETDKIGTVTKLMFQGVEIAGVVRDEENHIAGVSLILTPEEAEDLLYASMVGDVHYAVVPYGYKEIYTLGMTENQFIQKYVDNAPNAIKNGLSLNEKQKANLQRLNAEQLQRLDALKLSEEELKTLLGLDAVQLDALFKVKNEQFATQAKRLIETNKTPSTILDDAIQKGK